MDYPPQLHIGFQALHAFRAKHGSFPGPHNAEHAAEVLASAKEIAAKDKEPVVSFSSLFLTSSLSFSSRYSYVFLQTLSDDLMKQLSYGAQGDISPMVC